jgi:hypothetical protein
VRANLVYSLGTACERMGDAEGALAWYRSALPACPHHVVSRYRTGLLCLQLGLLEDGERDLASQPALLGLAPAAPGGAPLPAGPVVGGGGGATAPTPVAGAGGDGSAGATVGAGEGAVGSGPTLAPIPTSDQQMLGVGSALLPVGAPLTTLLMLLTLGRTKQRQDQHAAAITWFDGAVVAAGAGGLSPGEPLLHRAQSWLALGNPQVRILPLPRPCPAPAPAPAPASASAPAPAPAPAPLPLPLPLPCPALPRSVTSHAPLGGCCCGVGHPLTEGCGRQ